MTEKRKRKRALFVTAHEHFYGVRVVERNPESDEVMSVVCMFCAAFGRENDPRAPVRQRARTQKPKYWRGPSFRSDNYNAHLTVQHPEKWQYYRMLSLEEKMNFFKAFSVPLEKETRKSLLGNTAATSTASLQSVPEKVKLDEDQGLDVNPVENWNDTPATSKVETNLVVEATRASAAATSEPNAEPVVAEATEASGEKSREVLEPDAVVSHEDLIETVEPVVLERGGGWTFLLDRDVVDVALEVLFQSTEAGVKVFESTIDERDAQDQQKSDGTAQYRAVVLSMEFFQQVVELLALGLSFEQTAAICIFKAKSHVDSGPPGNSYVVNMARVAMAANLQVLSRILQRSCAFALHLRIGERQHLDVHLRACCSGKIEVFHLLSLPIETGGDSSTIGESLFNKTDQLLQGLHKRWLYKLIGCSTEISRPENADISAVVSAVAVSLSRKVKQQGLPDLIRVSSVRPPLDVMVQRFSDSILFADNGEWYGHFVGLSAYLQRQISTGNADELISAAVGPCPRVLTCTWWKLVDALRWFDNARVPIQQLLARRNASISPPLSWWLHLKVTFVIGSMAIKARTGLMGGYANLLSQQPQRIAMLRLALAGDIGVEGPLPEYQRTTLRDESISGSLIGSNDGMFSVKPQSVESFLRGMGSWVAEMFDELRAEERQKIIVDTANRVLELVRALHSLEDDLEQHRGSSISSLRSFPPVLPHQVAALHPVDFKEILRRLHTRLTGSLSDADVLTIETQQHELRTAATEDAAVHQLLKLRAGDPDTSFDQAWAVFRSRWTLLADFYGGLATVFLPLKSDCGSVAALESTATGNSSLDVRLQCQQFARLQAVDDCQSTVSS